MIDWCHECEMHFDEIPEDARVLLGKKGQEDEGMYVIVCGWQCQNRYEDRRGRGYWSDVRSFLAEIQERLASGERLPA